MDTTAEGGGESLKSGSAVEDRQSVISNVQSQIDVLTDLSRRLQAVRQFPSGLLRSEHTSGENQVLQVPLSSTLKGSFSKYVEDLRTLHVAVVEEKVQEVLRTAAESERRDGNGIKDTREKEVTQKRQCVFTILTFLVTSSPSAHVHPAVSYVGVEYTEYPPSVFRRSPTPESPRPYLAFQHKVSSPFPPLAADDIPLTLRELPAYVQEFNATHTKMLLHIYLASGRESRNITVPVVLRFLIPDVLRAFITLGHEERTNGAVSETPALMVESLTVFGSREKKPPHSQSEFTVFQKLSQWVVRMLQSSPCVPVQSFMGMLVAYESLFLEKCPLCQRFLSVEGYLPPVARIRRDDGTWEPRHATCVQN
ncbi:hypothetical protein EDB85DRAFT_191552 [Lactarius pseudohatsudake]|nr:hypothetical protein EDB85DRAFT_191552 [Lactarius pseudohatsudake]